MQIKPLSFQIPIAAWKHVSLTLPQISQISQFKIEAHTASRWFSHRVTASCYCSSNNLFYWFCLFWFRTESVSSSSSSPSQFTESRVWVNSTESLFFFVVGWVLFCMILFPLFLVAIWYSPIVFLCFKSPDDPLRVHAPHWVSFESSPWVLFTAECYI